MVNAWTHYYQDKSQGRYEQAELLFVQALALIRKLLPEEHPHTVIARQSLERLRDRHLCNGISTQKYKPAVVL